MSDTCDHKYVYMGFQYADGANPLPGSGARRRYYAHAFYCERCLEQRAELIEYSGDNTYSKPHEGATKGRASLIVPVGDRTYGYV